MAVETSGYASFDAESELKPYQYQIRKPEANDVLIDVHYCGICHSDIHAARSEWSPALYPLVPGHELTGVVREIGSDVSKFRIGDRVGVGCRVGSCRNCRECYGDEEQYCLKAIRTYNGLDHTGEPTRGGYGRVMVIPEDFVLQIPDVLPMDRAAPLLCAGITTYAPIVRNGLDKGGKRVAVIGLGGLGHMAVQFLAKMGNTVTVITRSKSKEDEAKALGAQHFLAANDDPEFKSIRRSFDYILDTVATAKPMDIYLDLLDVGGTLITVGLPPKDQPLKLNPSALINGRRNFQGSLIGGIKETQEMLNYCAEQQILPLIEVIKIDYVNEAWNRVLAGDVKFRFVIDHTA